METQIKIIKELVTIYQVLYQIRNNGLNTGVIACAMCSVAKCIEEQSAKLVL